jgi:hypothetical protein
MSTEMCEPRRSVPPERRDDRAAGAEPERLLLDAIADGELDHSLHAVADAVDARLGLLQTVKAASALAQLNVGDTVRLNHKVRPRYLQGAQGRVIAVDERDATVGLNRPVGRFTTGQLRCPPLVLERIAPAR